MRPDLCLGESVAVTALDLAAFDAIGWDVRPDVLHHPDWRFSTLSLPEPGAWGLMLAGLGLAGAAIRRTRRLDTVDD